ncbi:cytochrome P450 [Aspergillus avenaceus]|uniref:Cytochrome P450 n=1 Tax=Aspergillus avenaceus TaxID=36643 RepID=A0A5N6U039_ASPAV|nr:cytochrome P450 [Aspergillus avenaceus]
MDRTLPGFKVLPTSGIASRVVHLFLSVLRYISQIIFHCVANVFSNPFPKLPRVYGYPILGLLPQSCNDGLPASTRDLFEAAAHDGASWAWIGPLPLVYIRDPSLIRKVFVENEHRISRVGSNGRGPFSILERTVGDMVLTAEGEQWSKWHRSFVKNVNTTPAHKRYYPNILRIAGRHVEKLRIQKSGDDIFHAVQDFSLDAAWSLALGIDDAAASSVNLLKTFAQFSLYPGNLSHLWRHRIRNMIWGRPNGAADTIEQSMKHRIDTCLKAFLEGHIAQLNPDIPDRNGRFSFLQDVSRASGGTAQNPITGDVMAQARQMFVFGHEASASLVFWAMYEVSLHPDVARNIRSELLAHGWSKDNANFETLRELSYLDAVFNEVLRVHPPVLNTARLVDQPIELQTRNSDAVIIPRDTMVISSIHFLHHDSQVWEHADAFRPERWKDLLPNALENKCEYIPFLAGRRRCPSSNFVALQVKVMLAMLFSQLDLELPGVENMEDKLDIVVRPSQPVKYVVRELQ